MICLVPASTWSFNSVLQINLIEIKRIIVRSNPLLYFRSNVIYRVNGVLDEFSTYSISIHFNNKLFTTKFQACEAYVYIRMNVSSMVAEVKTIRTILVPTLINCIFVLETLKCIDTASWNEWVLEIDPTSFQFRELNDERWAKILGVRQLWKSIILNRVTMTNERKGCQ